MNNKEKIYYLVIVDDFYLTCKTLEKLKGHFFILLQFLQLDFDIFIIRLQKNQQEINFKKCA